jgi:superfamily II DNA/RNA helicase
VHVEATPENTTVDAITQKYIQLLKRKNRINHKINYRRQLAANFGLTRTKQGANKLTENAESRNKSRSYSRKQRSEQEPALAGFKDGTLTALVATDIAARGLDIPLLPHVVNFELPIFQRITFTVLVVLEELELMVKQYLYLALTKRFFYYREVNRYEITNRKYCRF